MEFYFLTEGCWRDISNLVYECGSLFLLCLSSPDSLKALVYFYMHTSCISLCLYKEISFDPREARGENGNRAFLLPEFVSLSVYSLCGRK